MIHEQIATAATIEEATSRAKAALNAPLDADIKFEVLQRPQKKTLGLFGGKDAKVRVYYETEDPKPVVKKPDPPKKPAAAEVKPAAPEAKKEERPAPKKQEKKRPAPQKKAEKPAAKPEAEPQSAPAAEPAMSQADIDSVSGYVLSIIHGMGIEDATIEVRTEEEETIFEIITETNPGALIGRHGETLDAVQYLVRLYANKNVSGHQKVSINIGDYRKKRSDNLVSLAQRSAKNVLKYGRSAKLEPMNPYERRIIHTTVQGIEGVTSHSVGFDTGRRVIISLEEGYQPTNARKGGGRGNDRGRGGRGGDRRGGGRGGKRGYEAVIDPDRQPRNDAAGIRYGRVEVSKPAESEE